MGREATWPASAPTSSDFLSPLDRSEAAAAMPKESGFSKAFAGAFVFLTVSVVVGIVTMVIFYKTQIGPLHPTPRPTPPSVTTSLPPVTRLPEHLLPQRYRVVLQPHLYTRIVEVVNVTSPNQTMLFTGNSSVTFLCVRSTSVVYLHSEDLELSGAAVTDQDSGERVGVSWMKQREDKGRFLEVQLGAPLAAGGNYSLFLAFRGTMTEDLYGLYVSRYSEGTPAYEGDTDTERFLAATQMEPTDARRVFPCFDEPALKAVFDVTIVHRRDTIALGNADMKDSYIVDDDWKVTHFHPTPKMSTYLFAITVSEFTKSASSPPGRVDIKTYGRSDAIDAGHAHYAAVVTGKILKFYEDYFEIGYEQRTLDQVALPDLGIAAMENWGLVTYQEGGLLYEEGVSSLLHKDNIAFIVAHELAHQWFGNLVTMKWWNDIWLNEGFATYLSAVAVDHVEPHSNMKDAQFMTNLHAAFEQDALASSHPLSPPEEDVQMTYEIEDMFDSITYCKGAAVLRMLSFIVTERVFTKGIRMYLSDFSYKNTDQNDLWKYIQKAEDEGGFTNIAKVMNTWTKQIGFPVITINTTSGEIYQKHFLFNDSSESNLWWSVPVSFMSNTKDSSYFLLETSDTMTKDEFISKSGEWILANINCTGYYRVNYNPENWERLLTQLETNPQRIPLMNRGQLVDDAFNLARAKLLEVTLALNSTRFLHDERGYIPWASTVKNLEYFVLMFDRSEVYGPMQAYLREQVSGLYDFFRNDTDHSQVPKDHSAQHNQLIAIDVACSNALPECLEMATKMFADWMNSNDTNSIHPNLRSVIYCQAVAAGGKEEWEFAWERYQSSVDTSEKEQLREALSCTKQIWLLNRYLEYTLNPEKIRLMDVGSTILSVADNVAGQALAWNFVRAHWDYVSRTGPARLIEGVTRRFSTKFELEELERFAADYNLSPTNYVEQAMEQTRVNIQWVGENADAVLEWFENEAAR